MATQMPEQAGVFTRASSGLVRQVKAQDVAYYGIQQIALSYIVFIVLAWGAYPGSSMPLASVIAMVGGLAMGVCYAMFATLYPRSGGEYVYLSRTLFPVVGFIVSFSFALWETFYTGINGAFFSLYSVSPFLSALGLQTHSSGLLSASNWFAGNWGIFIGGSALIVSLTYLQIRGAGVYFRWQRWATLLALASLVVTVLVLIVAAAGGLDFRTHFNDLVGAGAYEKIAAQGAQGAAAPFDFGQTLKFMIWPAFSIWFAVASTSFSGEVKNVERGGAGLEHRRRRPRGARPREREVPLAALGAADVGGHRRDVPRAVRLHQGAGTDLRVPGPGDLVHRGERVGDLLSVPAEGAVRELADRLARRRLPADEPAGHRGDRDHRVRFLPAADRQRVHTQPGVRALGHADRHRVRGRLVLRLEGLPEAAGHGPRSPLQ